MLRRFYQPRSLVPKHPSAQVFRIHSAFLGVIKNFHCHRLA